MFRWPVQCAQLNGSGTCGRRRDHESENYYIERISLVERLAKDQIPLTVCPLSNLKLCVFDSMEEHNLKQLLDAGLCVTINSDDPAYFGGYICENFLRSQQALGLDAGDIHALAKNAFTASFLGDDEKNRFIAELDQAMA